MRSVPSADIPATAVCALSLQTFVPHTPVTIKDNSFKKSFSAPLRFMCQLTDRPASCQISRSWCPRYEATANKVSYQSERPGYIQQEFCSLLADTLPLRQI